MVRVWRPSSGTVATGAGTGVALETDTTSGCWTVLLPVSIESRNDQLNNL